MKYTVESEETKFVVKRDGNVVYTPNGMPVVSENKELAERLVRDMNLYGEKIGNFNSIVLYHYDFLDFAMSSFHEIYRAAVNISKSDTMLEYTGQDAAIAEQWAELMPATDPEKVSTWLKALAPSQICAVVVAGGYIRSVNALYQLATHGFSQEYLLKLVSLLEAMKGHSDGKLEAFLKNFIYYFNAQTGFVGVEWVKEDILH